MKTSVLLLVRIAALWISVVCSLHAEKEPLSTPDFATAYLKQLEAVVGVMKIIDRGALDNDGSFFFTSISPTFKLGLDPKTGTHTIFDDGKSGPMALFVFRSPLKLRQSFGGLDNILASGELNSKAPHNYVCCANGHYFVLLVSEEKKIPMDSEAVLTLSKMIPRTGKSYWKK